jgi:hypothetical protein
MAHRKQLHFFFAVFLRLPCQFLHQETDTGKDDSTDRVRRQPSANHPGKALTP